MYVEIVPSSLLADILKYRHIIYSVKDFKLSDNTFFEGIFLLVIIIILGSSIDVLE